MIKAHTTLGLACRSLYVFGNDGLWFAEISPETGKIIPGEIRRGEHRASIATRDLKLWLKKVALPYHSPHKFRHGHAVFALKLAKDVAALKAVSQNLMHTNLSITDGVYGILSESDTRKQIFELGEKFRDANTKNINEINFLIKQLITKLDILG